MISVKKAEGLILGQTISLGSEKIELTQGVGRILCSEIQAERNGPPFDRIAMDGIAIVYSQIENDSFNCEGMQAAGMPQLVLKNKVNCLEVMTGAMLPKGCDTVIQFENTEKEGDRYKIIDKEKVKEKQNIHFCGQDFSQNDLLLPKDYQLKIPDIAVAASEGKDELNVYKSPKIALITTGSELVEINEIPLAHQIRMSNRYTAETLLRSKGIHDITRIHLLDDEKQSESVLSDCFSKFDVLILSGGVSKGKKDYIPECLKKLGVQIHFHRIAQKPGKPMLFGSRENCRIFAMPGNPASMLVCTVRYFLPWYYACMKMNRKPVNVKLTSSIKRKGSLTLFSPVRVYSNEKAELIAELVKNNGSGDYYHLSQSNGFIEIPGDKETVSEGDIFEYFDWNYSL